MKWMRTAEQNYREIFSPLQDTLEKFYKTTSQSASRAAAKILLRKFEWDKEIFLPMNGENNDWRTNECMNIEIMLNVYVYL